MLPNEACILLTGATGFLGKVVLEELFRRRSELQFAKVVLLTRPKRGKEAKVRFEKEVAVSPCFANLPFGWTDSVEIVEGDVTKQTCGMIDDDYKRLCADITHVIHCAANSQPLRIARKFPKMRKFISTSTAYVSPHTSKPILEELTPLPFDCALLLEKIEKGEANEKELLRLTGHGNTYSLTKCIAEHLILGRASECVFPVTIVRPSMVSASIRYPFPGWIDSPAALAAVFIAIGTGYLRVLDGKGSTRIDSVPVDQVAGNLIDEAFATESPQIVFSVATLRHSTDVATFCDKATAHFNSKSGPGAKPIRGVSYIGPRNLWFYAYEFGLQKVPLSLAKGYYALQMDSRKRLQVEKIRSLLSVISRTYPHYASADFDFQPKADFLANLDPEKYLALTFEGMDKHLLSKL